MTITLKIKATQTIAADDVTATYGDTNKSVSASVTTPATGGGAISYAVKEGSEDYISVASDGKLTIKKVPADGKAYVIVTAAETDAYLQATEEVTINISEANAVAAIVTANNRTYDGTKKPLVTVDNSTLVGGTMQYALGTATEATQSYSASIPAASDAGSYFVWYRVVGDDNHKDADPASVEASIARAPIAKAKVTLAQASFAYDGKAKTPGIKSVVLGGRTLVAGTDYTVSYKNNVQPGTATAVVTGIGNYAGTATASFSIAPTKAKLVTYGFTKTSSMDATWKKVAGASGYELQYRLVGGAWKTLSATGTSKTLRGLKVGRLYELRVRAVAGSVKGPWSATAMRYFFGVSGVKAKSGKSGTVTATWRKDPKANAGYDVLVRYQKGGAVVAKAHVAAGKTSATVKGLAKGRKVWVEVRPLRKSGTTTYIGVLHGAWGKA